MASSFTVTSQQLRDKAAELRNQNNNLKSQIENLRSQESSLNSMWEGEARQAFKNAFDQDIAKMLEFIKAIEAFIVALINIAEEYEKAENKNISTASTRK